MILNNFLISIVYILLAICYKSHFYKRNWNEIIRNPIKVIRDNKIVIPLFLFISFVVSLIHLKGNMSFLLSLEYLTLIFTEWVMSEIDFKKRLIPNQLVLFLFVSRLIFLWVGNVLNVAYMSSFIYSSFIGLLIGGGVLLVAKILSKSGIGFGDVKMFAVIGFFVGANGIISLLFYTFLLTAIVGGTLLILKKLTTQDTLPLAPFAFLALLLYFPLTYVHW